GAIEVPRLAYQGRQQQAGREKAYAHLDHHPWPATVHQSADKRTTTRRDEEPKGERPGRRAPLPAKFVEDGREGQRKGRARIDAQAHSDKDDSHNHPAVEDRETPQDRGVRPAPVLPPQHSLSTLVAGHGTPYVTAVGIRCTGGSPRPTRWMFSAMP